MSATVKVFAGRNLIAKDKTGKSDPFLTIETLGLKDATKKVKTNVVKQNLDPTWNEEFQIPVVDVRNQSLHFTCWDWDRLKKNDFMGQFTVTLKEIVQKGNKFEGWVALIPNAKGGKVTGEIHVSISLVPPKGQENVFKDDDLHKVVASTGPAMLSEADIEEMKGKKLTDFFTVEKELGKGAFAVVKLCTHKKTGLKFAVKMIDRSAADQNLAREIEVMKKVNHPHVIRLVAIFEEDKSLNLVMELVTGGELFDKIVEKGSYSEKEAAQLVTKIVDAIGYLHSIGIAHRDLKPENLLLATPHDVTDVKIADFGLSRMVNNTTMMQTACGTPGYVAPEVLMAQGYGSEVDMWSIGVITYILLCGFPPFYSEDLPELFDQIMKAQYVYHEEYWGHISKDAKDFIDHLLKVSPAERFTAKQALQHRWLTSHDHSTKESGAATRMKTTVANRKQHTSSSVVSQ